LHSRWGGNDYTAGRCNLRHMDKLRAIHIFIHIVQTGSLTAAARKLDMSLSAVVRALAALERSLGVRLLTRTTRRIAITDEGQEYFERCKEILAHLEAVEAATRARQNHPSGLLRITAPVTFGRRHMAPVVVAYLQQFVDMRIELLLLDRVVDLLEDNLDAAVRIGALADSTWVAVPLGHTARVWCASPAYLRLHGQPGTPAALSQHRCIVNTGFSAGGAWEFGSGMRMQRPTIAPVLSVNHVEAAVDACCAGLGIGSFLHYQVHEALHDGRLCRVLASQPPRPLPVNLLLPAGRLMSRRLRSFVDWAGPALRERLQAS
jgi:DNA-binding transcriptional LysR family regulator